MSISKLLYCKCNVLDAFIETFTTSSCYFISNLGYRIPIVDVVQGFLNIDGVAGSNIQKNPGRWWQSSTGWSGATRKVEVLSFFWHFRFSGVCWAKSQRVLGEFDLSWESYFYLIRPWIELHSNIWENTVLICCLVWWKRTTYPDFRDFKSSN